MKNLKLSDFELGRPIGKGNFGQVWLAKHISTDFLVALKIIPKKAINSDTKQCKQLRRELEIHSILESENIIRLFCYFHDHKNIYLVLEYAHGGELYKLLKDNNKFDEKTAANYILQISKAVKKMQQYNIIHRDIKPENILITHDNKLKLCDFGWAVCNIDNRRETFCGTGEYLCPEILNKQTYCKKVDIWCLGVLTYELLTGYPPFNSHDVKSANDKIRVANFKIPGHFSKEAKDFIQRMLKVEPQDRIGIEEVINHEWIVKNL